MNNSIITPEKLVIGFKNERNGTKNDTNPIKLAFIVYYDNKGVLRKEHSWNNWRDKGIESIELENNPTSGFILSSAKTRGRDWFGSGRTMWRITHPTGFQFEISSNNLESIIGTCDIIGGEIIGQCVLAWSGTVMSLVPITSELYVDALKNTQRIGKELIKPSEIKPGSTILLQDGTETVYLGKFKYLVSSNWNEEDYVNQSGSSIWGRRNYRTLKSDYIKCFNLEKLKTPIHLILTNKTVGLENTLKIVEVINNKTISEQEVYNILSKSNWAYSTKNSFLALNEPINMANALQINKITITEEYLSPNINNFASKIFISSYIPADNKVIFKGEYLNGNNKNKTDFIGKENIEASINYKGLNFKIK